MSPTLQTANVFDQYRSLMASSLLWRIYKANRFDLAVDVVWCTTSVILNYLAPFFMQRILYECILALADVQAVIGDRSHVQEATCPSLFVWIPCSARQLHKGSL